MFVEAGVCYLRCDELILCEEGRRGRRENEGLRIDSTEYGNLDMGKVWN